MQIQTSHIHPLHSWPKVSGDAPFAPLRREDAVVCSQSQGCDLSGYSAEYRLREEAHKSWQHAVTEELVYCEDVIGADSDSGSSIAKDYLEGDLWMHVEFAFVSQGNTEYSVIVESFKSYQARVRCGGEKKLNFRAVSGNPPVLVEVTHSVQPPKKILFHGCRSVCWLQVSDNGDRIIGDANQVFLESTKAVTVPVLHNRELSTVGNCDSEFSQSPHKLVEGGAHAVEGITASQADIVGNVRQINAEDVPLIFKVILTAKSAGLRFVENLEVRVESLKVTLRPIQLQIGVCKSGSDHDLRG